ncbi:alpha/beta hydrolase [Amycolatopsis sp. NPDC004368]
MPRTVHEHLAAVVPLLPDAPFSDLAATREMVRLAYESVRPDLTGVELTERTVAPGVAVRIFRPATPATTTVAALLDIHGGGFATGSAALDDSFNAHLVRTLGIVVVSVDYRLAPEHPFPTPVEDCYSALSWLAANAAELGADPARIGVLGDSAGAGLAAGVALLARDRGGPRLVFQALIEPVLDDRLTTTSMNDPEFTTTWSREQAVLSWQYYLGDQAADPSPYAAPARADVTGLPPTYLAVNELDVLRDEGLDYARRLLEAGVPTELHCWPATFHGSHNIAPDAPISQRTRHSLVEALLRGLNPAQQQHDRLRPPAASDTGGRAAAHAPAPDSPDHAGPAADVSWWGSPS